MAKLRVVVVDDSPDFVEAITALLEFEFDVMATAGDGKTVLDLVSRYKPDLVVLDIDMPAFNGIGMTRQLVKHCPRVVICSVTTDHEIVDAARRAGALGYVFKSRMNRDLIDALNSAAQGKPFVSPVHRQ